MPALRFDLIAAALLASTLFSLEAAAAPAADTQPPESSAPGSSASAPAAQPPLRSRAELDTWLAENRGKPTPFDALSAGGRQRVLALLHFSDQGLGSPPGDELSWELDRPQAVALLELFGREEWAGMLDYHALDTKWKGSASTPSAMDQRYLAYIKEEEAAYNRNSFQYESNISHLYRKHFQSSLFAQADQLSDPDLLLLARVAASVEHFTAAQPELLDLLALLPKLQQRGLDVTPLATVAQHGLMRNGRLNQARALADEYPAVRFDPIPSVTVAPEQLAPGPKWWRLSADGQNMTAESADLSGTQIFVLAGCHFSIEAAEDVRKDPELAPVFARHAHWLGEPPGSEKIDAWKEWNDKLPETPIHLITLRSDWAVFPDWNMPTYAVVRDGKLIDKTTGSWRKYPENRAALVDMLRRHGLMPPAGEKAASITAVLRADAPANAKAD